ERTILKWFNTDVFTSFLNSTSTNATAVSHLRTFKTRFSAVRQDNINNLDLSLLKTVSLPRGIGLQLRAEFINVLNEPYFPVPVTGQTSDTFGKVTAAAQSNYARRAQLGVKLLF
ncbi:MAG: hypothetical protein IMZ65_00590, partial [Planctomycetes bacterium]|nr:hypothetical protein [Planctomycetota bacterium]